MEMVEKLREVVQAHEGIDNALAVYAFIAQMYPETPAAQAHEAVLTLVGDGSITYWNWKQKGA